MQAWQFLSGCAGLDFVSDVFVFHFLLDRIDPAMRGAGIDWPQYHPPEVRGRQDYFLFHQFPPARKALALAASFCLAGGLACEAGGDEIDEFNLPAAEGKNYASLTWFCSW